MRFSRPAFDALTAVLRLADEKPADAALREVLRAARLEPHEARDLSRALFSFYRWFGFLDPAKGLRARVDHALELADRFAASSKSISDADLLERALPPWVHDVMRLTPALVRALQREPRLWLRARPGGAAELSSALGDCERHPAISDALAYRGELDLFRTPEFRAGAFEIQDLSSQAVGLICAPEPGELWWDACAGEGGKTLHLCDLMRNKGTVWATDRAAWRLETLRRRAARAGLFNYRVKVWANPAHLPVRAKFDGALVDAPCSGIGTWGRNPHARWTARPEDIVELAAVQARLLDFAAQSLKPGGRLVYSVCTLTTAETADAAQLFESTHARFEPAACSDPLAPENKSARLEILPQKTQANGMFVAVWKNGGGK